MNQLYYGDNLDVLRTLADESVDLIYLDPPFGAGLLKDSGKSFYE